MCYHPDSRNYMPDVRRLQSLLLVQEKLDRSNGSLGQELVVSSDSPLRGVRILDFSRLLPGPYATSILASLGVEVVKVEDPCWVMLCVISRRCSMELV